jgi:hypothetical protein
MASSLGKDEEESASGTLEKHPALLRSSSPPVRAESGSRNREDLIIEAAANLEKVIRVASKLSVLENVKLIEAIAPQIE